MQTLLAIVTRLALAVSQPPWLDVTDREQHSERGATTLEWTGLGAISIAVIIVLGAAMQVMGLNVITWIQKQLIGA
jgi:hypothetical protein